MPTRSLYFINWWADALVVGGLSIIVWLGLLGFVQAAESPVLGLTVYLLALLVNFPHFSATTYRLYQSPQNIRQFPMTAWVVPPVLLGAVVASFWQPTVIAPYFLMLYLLWSPYHYGGQTIGLTMIYAKRAGFRIGRVERMALSTFVYSAVICGVIGFQTFQASNGYINSGGVPVPAFAVPNWLYASAQAAMWGSAAVFLGGILVQSRNRGRLLPPIVLLPAVTHAVWFVAGPGLKSFWAFIPFFHSLQYMLIALAMQLAVRVGSDGERSWPRLRFEGARWWLRNMIGGSVLFVALPALIIWPSVPALTSAAVLVAAFNIHHFFVDGVIWKLRDTATLSALTMNLAESSRPMPVQPLAARA